MEHSLPVIRPAPRVHAVWHTHCPAGACLGIVSCLHLYLFLKEINKSVIATDCCAIANSPEAGPAATPQFYPLYRVDWASHRSFAPVLLCPLTLYTAISLAQTSPLLSLSSADSPLWPSKAFTPNESCK